MTPQDRIMVALDRPTTEENLAIVHALADQARIFKVGMRQYYAGAEEVIAAVRASGAALFLDLKLHDIPATVAGAVRSLASIRPDFLTIHASGGAAMIRAAVEALAEVHPSGKILAVTVLTSMTSSDLHAFGSDAQEVLPTVLRLAQQAVQAGAHGVVASPLEAASLRPILGDKKIVTPGVRPQDASHDDQKRVMTPQQALDAGADYLVIGRPIHAAADPRASFERIVGSIR